MLFRCPESLLKRISFLWTNNTFWVSSGLWTKNYYTFGGNIFCQSWQVFILRVQKILLSRRVFLEASIFLKDFKFKHFFFCSCLGKNPAVLSKLQSVCPEEFFDGKYLFETYMNFYFYTNSSFKQKYELLSKNNWQNVKLSFYKSGRIFWKKESSETSIYFSHNPSLSKNVSGGCRNRFLRVPKNILNKNKFWTNYISFY